MTIISLINSCLKMGNSTLRLVNWFSSRESWQIFSLRAAPVQQNVRDFDRAVRLYTDSRILVRHATLNVLKQVHFDHGCLHFSASRTLPEVGIAG